MPFSESCLTRAHAQVTHPVSEQAPLEGNPDSSAPPLSPVADSAVTSAIKAPSHRAVDAITPPLRFSTPFDLPERRERVLRSSFALSSGYDTAVDDIPHAAGGITLMEGSTGVLLQRSRLSFLLEHDAKLSNSIGTGLGVQQYQLSTATLTGLKSPRTNWTLLLQNGYGSDATRAVGSLSDAALPAGADQNAASFLLTAGDTLSDHASFSMQHRVSPSHVLDFSAGTFVHHFFNIGTSDYRYNLNAGIRQHRWTRQTIGVRAEAVEENYQDLRCTTGSIALYGYTQIARSTHFEGTIGPVWGSASCSGTYQYDLSLTTNTARGSLLYVGTTRRSSDGLVLDSTWENSSFGGFSAGQPIRLQMRVDAGYVSYLVAHPTPINPDLHGYFTSVEFHHRLSASSELSLTARYFARGPSVSKLDRSLILLTYTWSREQRRTRIRTYGVARDGQ
jgi:hypothetical protein